MADGTQQAARDRVQLSVGGKLYEGWKSVEIRRGLDTLCSSFSVSMAERAPFARQAFPFEAGAAVALRIGSEVLVTGWIDQLSPDFDAQGHAIRIVGRDKAGDLIDCSAMHPTSSWANTPLETIAQDLAKPFGIKITAKASTAPRIKRFALQQGESAFDAIERLCRFRALLPVSTADGNVELIAFSPAAPVETLTQGVNILSGSADHNTSERFSRYILKGQASGDDDSYGATVSKIRAEATDPAITRHRPLIIIAEDQADRATLEKRARWEAVTRAGRAQTATIKVPGWRTPAGQLRNRGMTFDVEAPWLFVSGKMLAVEVALRFGDDGTTSEITFARPEAFTQLKIPETANASDVKDRIA